MSYTRKIKNFVLIPSLFLLAMVLIGCGGGGGGGDASSQSVPDGQTSNGETIISGRA
jgi:hypothetical protein